MVKAPVLLGYFIFIYASKSFGAPPGVGLTTG